MRRRKDRGFRGRYRVTGSGNPTPPRPAPPHPAIGLVSRWRVDRYVSRWCMRKPYTVMRRPESLWTKSTSKVTAVENKRAKRSAAQRSVPTPRISKYEYGLRINVSYDILLVLFFAKETAARYHLLHARTPPQHEPLVIRMQVYEYVDVLVLYRILYTYQYLPATVSYSATASTTAASGRRQAATRIVEDERWVGVGWGGGLRGLVAEAALRDTLVRCDAMRRDATRWECHINVVNR
ncbi:hypothetical protein V9T40_011721 [Parthenolecanium corni]|uniref:Uncharacterized protein n=1 Tax=Parthenolecanium corni TaxID=536013 RepID=A0AAN9T6K2_9HEMI